MISRLTVDAARPSDAAIERSDWPATTPREISSRSDRLNDRLERLRFAGRMPPVCDRMFCIDEWLRPKWRPIELSDSPFRQRSHINDLSASVE